MAYDAGQGEVVLFGGWDTFGGFPTYFDDTWAWDGTGWTLSAITGPSRRYDHAMAYDTTRDEVVLFGGQLIGSFDDETWAWADLCPADLDGDGDADSDDFFGYLDAFASGDLGVCDLDGDGDCDSDDFFSYLDLFAAGC